MTGLGIRNWIFGCIHSHCICLKYWQFCSTYYTFSMAIFFENSSNIAKFCQKIRKNSNSFSSWCYFQKTRVCGTRQLSPYRAFNWKSTSTLSWVQAQKGPSTYLRYKFWHVSIFLEDSMDVGTKGPKIIFYN